MKIPLRNDKEESVSTLVERLDLRGIETDWATQRRGRPAPGHG